MSNLISCYDLETKELKHFKVPESVYVYVKQLESAIVYSPNHIKRKYYPRLGEPTDHELLKEIEEKTILWLKEQNHRL